MAPKSKKPHHKGLSDDDRLLWRIIAQTVRPLRKPDFSEVSVSPVVLPPTPMTPSALIAQTALGPVKNKPKDRSLDRRTRERFIQGKMPIEARIDLHGMTGPVARQQVISFIIAGHRAGCRCVLVITGKGAPEGGGVLQQSLPHWLEDPEIAHMVLAHSPAQPRDGGHGAFYVLIRRQR